MTDTDEDFARWAVAVAYLSDEPERFLPGGGAETVATLLVQAVHEAREAKDAEPLLSVMLAVFGERFDRFERKEKFIRRFVVGEAGFPTAEDYDRIAKAITRPCESTNIVRIDRWDAEACRDCKRWLSRACSDPACDFCADRPADASEADFDDPRNTKPRPKQPQTCDAMFEEMCTVADLAGDAS